jgi:predicted transcriptional regulator
MKIQDIMTKDPSCVTADATVREAAQVMSREDVGIVPVVDARSDNRLVGVVTDRDIAIRCVAEGKDGTCSVRDVMSTSKLATCAEDDDVAAHGGHAKKKCVNSNVDERGSLVGTFRQTGPQSGRWSKTPSEQWSLPGAGRASPK